MRILVTGAAGRLGQAVLKAAAGRHEVVPFDVRGSEGTENLIVGDVSDLDTIMEVAEGCDAIIHTAALHGGHIKTHSHADYIRINVQGTDNLYQAALRYGIRKMVYSSTMEVTLGRNWDTWGASLQDEDTPPRPDSIYSLTKLLAEQLGHYYSRMHGIKVASMRYMSFDSRPPEQIGLGLVARWVWVMDAAEANLLAAESDRVEDDIFHIGPLTKLTYEDIVEGITNPEVVLERRYPGSIELLKIAGITIGRSLWPVTSISKGQRILGWTPQYTFEDYLQYLRRQLIK